ncbi:hypothetical protein O181_084493 [Austropuccinia psidii MF-1]|uniref:CCHC-type domain-containing protein n=1 Tax=Austropuccinia psidii MF-1 TaxID=1389203 RepID=A0A9Q3IKP7_9BASI|nr:hypothetical protein [Austropuccinia psidii MF-1]
MPCWLIRQDLNQKYQDGDNMSYSEKEALKQLPEASSWPKFSATGEYDHMELIDYTDGLFIEVTGIPDYRFTARLNTEFKGRASIWYTEMKEIHGRIYWPWWKSHIIQRYSNGTWIWQKNIQSKRLKGIDPQMNTQMRNHKLLTQIPREPEHALKCRYNQNDTLDEIANTLQDFKDKPNEGVAEVAKKKNSCHNCDSTNHYSYNCPKAKKKVYVIEKVPEEESPTEKSDSDSMGDAIRAKSDKEQDPREELLVEYQEEAPLEIQDIQLEAGMPQDTANKKLCKHTQDAQTFLVTPTTGMAYIHGTATKMTVCIDNAHHPLIIDSGAHCSIVARNYLENHFQNWEKQLLPTRAKNFKSASGNMTSIEKIIKEIIIPHRKGKIRLNSEFVVLNDAHIQGFLLGTDYQKMYGTDIYNSKNRHIIIGTN